MYSTRTDCVKQRFGRFRLRKRVGNVRSVLNTIASVMCSAYRNGSDMNTIINPGKINIVPPQVPQLVEAKRQRHLLFEDPVEGLEK